MKHTSLLSEMYNSHLNEDWRDYLKRFGGGIQFLSKFQEGKDFIWYKGKYYSLSKGNPEIKVKDMISKLGWQNQPDLVKIIKKYGESKRLDLKLQSSGKYVPVPVPSIDYRK